MRVRASTKDSTASAGEDARDKVLGAKRKARWPQQQVCVRWRVEQERPLRVTAARLGLEVGFHRIDHPCVAAPSRVSKRPTCVCARVCVLNVYACVRRRVQYAPACEQADRRARARCDLPDDQYAPSRVALAHVFQGRKHPGQHLHVCGLRDGSCQPDACRCALHFNHTNSIIVHASLPTSPHNLSRAAPPPTFRSTHVIICFVGRGQQSTLQVAWPFALHLQRKQPPDPMIHVSRCPSHAHVVTICRKKMHSPLCLDCASM